MPRAENLVSLQREFLNTAFEQNIRLNATIFQRFLVTTIIKLYFTSFDPQRTSASISDPASSSSESLS